MGHKFQALSGRLSTCKFSFVSCWRLESSDTRGRSCSSIEGQKARDGSGVQWNGMRWQGVVYPLGLRRLYVWDKRWDGRVWYSLGLHRWYVWNKGGEVLLLLFLVFLPVVAWPHCFAPMLGQQSCTGWRRREPQGPCIPLKGTSGLTSPTSSPGSCPHPPMVSRPHGAWQPSP